MFGLQMIQEMDRMQREIDQLLHGVGATVRCDWQKSTGLAIEDRGDAYEVKAALPGIDVEKLDINVLGRKLTLAGEFAQPEVPEGANWHRRERACGHFEKTLQLATEVDAEQVEANYRQGMLEIRLPKAASVLPKKIQVKAA